MKGKLLFPLAGLLLFILSGCGHTSVVADEYPLEDVVTSENGDESTVYRVANDSVPAVAEEINRKNEALEMSEEQEDRMVLMYEEEVIQVMQDSDKPEDVLVETSSKAFVEQNYDPNFFAIYGMARLAGDLFSFNRTNENQSSGGFYGGYVNTSGNYTKQTGNGGSIRYGSTGLNGVRGGGPGAGK